MPQFTVSEMAESTDDDSIMVSKSQEYNIKHYSDSMINASNQVRLGRLGPCTTCSPRRTSQADKYTIIIRIVHVYTVISSQLF